MKYLLNVTKEDELIHLNDKVDGYILANEEFSINYNYYVKDDMMRQTINYLSENKKEIFVLLNKNIHNNKIEKLKEYLIFISTLEIDYLIYHDLAILNIVKEEGLNIKLIYGANMYVTNYNIINFYKDDIEGAVISSEIIREDIKLIKENTSKLLFYNVFGYLPMMFTKRKLVSHYFEFINDNKQDDVYYLEEKINKNMYPIIESNGICSIYNNKVINVINDEMCEYLDYGIINMFNLNLDLNDVLSGKVESNVNFLDTKTIYKVGNKHEKN